MPLPKSPRKLSHKTNYILEFEAIGTLWKIEIFEPHYSKATISRLVQNRISEFDKNYSRFRSDSLVTKMSNTVATYTLPDDAKPMMDLYAELYEHTKGHMTPLIGQALSDAGYDAEYSFMSKQLSATPAWDEALDYKFPTLTIKQPVLLDFGALGKGYLIDIIGDMLSKICSSFIINGGGDILQSGQKAVNIGLENPRDTNEAIGIATIRNNAICGSAGNRRTWADYNHIIDPETLRSPRHIEAVWAVARSTMLADAMTTALYFSDPGTLCKRYTFSYAIIASSGSLTYSPDFPAEFFNGDAA